MAYKRRLNEKCDRQYCRSGARWEVLNRANSIQGRFCSKHAEQALDQLHGIELEMDRKDDGA